MPSSASAASHTPPLSLHDALPIYLRPAPGYTSAKCGCELYALPVQHRHGRQPRSVAIWREPGEKLVLQAANPNDETCIVIGICRLRSEEHTSELQSHSDLVCRLLLPPPPTLPLFPYTTLFRSICGPLPGIRPQNAVVNSTLCPSSTDTADNPEAWRSGENPARSLFCRRQIPTTRHASSLGFAA